MAFGVILRTTMARYSSKVALLSRAIDYAGMFPPASLDLSSTLKKAATFRKTAKHPWLMNRLVLSINEFKKLNPEMLFEAGADGSPWNFSILGTPITTSTNEGFIKSVDWDFRELRRLQDRFFSSSCQMEAYAYEIRLPEEITQPGQAITTGEFIFPVLEQIEGIWPNEIDIYFEVSLQGAWQETLEGVTRIMGEWLAENEETPALPALKIRTGGQYIPTTEQLAFAINECASQGIKFKATQGLHHPISSHSDFGFVNLFAAISFAFAFGEEKFGLEQVKACLKEQDPREFQFSESHFCWKNMLLKSEEIEKVRKIHSACFGSCSLDEPDQFLLKEFP